MANINYKINKKQDGSYIYAEAVVTNIKNSATATPTTPSQEDEDERGV